MRHIILLIILAATVLMGCTPGAHAKARRIDAETRSINAQTRRINEIHDLWMERENALTGVKVETKANIIWSEHIILIAASAGLAMIGLWWGFNLVQADRKRRQFTATLIPLDPVTRQYPLLPFLTGSVWRIYDPNTKTVDRMDRCKKIDLHLADNQTRVQMTGLATGDAKLLLNGSGED